MSLRSSFVNVVEGIVASPVLSTMKHPGINSLFSPGFLDFDRIGKHRWKTCAAFSGQPLQTAKAKAHGFNTSKNAITTIYFIGGNLEIRLFR